MTRPTFEPGTAETDPIYLNPHNRAGESDMPDPPASRSAYDLKDLHDLLQDIPDDELKQIPVLDTGARLQEGATYLDLRKPSQGEITGMNNMMAEPENAYVAKSDVDHELWNLLTGIRDPGRLGRFAEDVQI